LDDLSADLCVINSNLKVEWEWEARLKADMEAKGMLLANWNKAKEASQKVSPLVQA
jgi:hypothetical protein